MTRVSIIVPVFRAENYLRACVGSILAQSFKDFEAILVDDASPDNCPQICEEYAASDPRVRVIHNPVNRGVSAARNAGLEIAVGGMVTFIDSDDHLEPDYLRTLVDALDLDDAVDYVMSGVAMETYGVDGVGADTVHYRVTSNRYDLRGLLEALNVDYPLICISGPWAKLYRRSVITAHDVRFDESMSSGEDGYFNLCFLEHVRIALAVDYVGYVYQRQNSASLYSVYNVDCVEIAQKVYGRMRDLIIASQCGADTRSRFEKMYFDMLVSCVTRAFAPSGQTSTAVRKEIVRKVASDRHAVEYASRLRPRATREWVLARLVLSRRPLVVHWAVSAHHSPVAARARRIRSTIRLLGRPRSRP